MRRVHLWLQILPLSRMTGMWMLVLRQVLDALVGAYELMFQATIEAKYNSLSLCGALCVVSLAILQRYVV